MDIQDVLFPWAVGVCMGPGSRGTVISCDCRSVAFLTSSIPRRWWWTCILWEIIRRELVRVFSTPQAAVPCHLPKANVGVILLATLFFPCRPVPLGTSPHRTKLKMRFLLHHCAGTRCKAYLWFSDPAAKFGSIPPCKICAKKITFLAYQVSLVFKKMLFMFVSASNRHHVNPVYLSAGEPYSQLSSHSWPGSGLGQAMPCRVQVSAPWDAAVGPSSLHVSPHCQGGSLTLQLGLQRERGQRESFICLGSTQTPWTWRLREHLGK